MFSGIVFIFCCFIIKLYKICCFNLNSLQKLYNYLQKQNIFDGYNNISKFSIIKRLYKVPFSETL